MSLIAFIGDLGAGKTLSLTLFAWINWKKGLPIYSNYHFFGFPFHFINKVSQIDKMHSGFFAGDELWLWVDSRESKKKRNRVISKILAKSRKRGMDIGYTTQSFRQVDVRIRNVTDYIAVPELHDGVTQSGKKVENAFCVIYTFRKGNMSKPIDVTKFRTDIVFKMYDTNEEVLENPEEEDELIRI